MLKRYILVFAIMALIIPVGARLSEAAPGVDESITAFSNATLLMNGSAACHVKYVTVNCNNSDATKRCIGYLINSANPAGQPVDIYVATITAQTVTRDYSKLNNGQGLWLSSRCLFRNGVTGVTTMSVIWTK